MTRSQYTNDRKTGSSAHQNIDSALVPIICRYPTENFIHITYDMLRDKKGWVTYSSITSYPASALIDTTSLWIHLMPSQSNRYRYYYYNFEFGAKIRSSKHFGSVGVGRCSTFILLKWIDDNQYLFVNGVHVCISHIDDAYTRNWNDNLIEIWLRCVVALQPQWSHYSDSSSHQFQCYVWNISGALFAPSSSDNNNDNSSIIRSELIVVSYNNWQLTFLHGGQVGRAQVNLTFISLCIGCHRP